MKKISNSYQKAGEWSNLAAWESNGGIMVGNHSRKTGDKTGIMILFKGAKLPVNDDELFTLWENRDCAKIIRKGYIVS